MKQIVVVVMMKFFFKTISCEFLEQNHDPIDTTAIIPARFDNMKNHLKCKILNYFTLRDIIPFGFICNTWYMSIFQYEETRILKQFCNIDIPAHVVPHVTI